MRSLSFRHLILILLGLALGSTLVFQNCSGAKFSFQSEPSSLDGARHSGNGDGYPGREFPVHVDSQTVKPGESVQLVPMGGVAPYTYSIIKGSGSISHTGLYTAGPDYDSHIRIEVRDATGRVSYVDLAVVDPTGVKGDSRFESPSSGQGDRFGFSGKLSDGVAAFGALGDDVAVEDGGAVYVFGTSSVGNWGISQTIAPSALNSFDHFGIATDLSGSTLLAGAHGDDSRGAGAGAAYIFSADSTGEFFQTQKLAPSELQEDDRFGRTLAVDGDTIAISAYRDDSACPDCGAVYFYKNNMGSWELQSKELPPTGTPDQGFGESGLSLEGDTLVGGAPGNAEYGSNAGAAYVFQRTPSGWHPHVLYSSNAAPGDRFGVAVATDGATVVVGAPGDDENGTDSGAAFVYEFDSLEKKWVFVQKLFSNSPSQSFGMSIAVSGDHIIVGDIHQPVESGGTGKVFVYRQVDGRWYLTNQVSASAFDHRFGSTVSISNNRVGVGSYGSTVGGQSEAGSLIFFDLISP